LPAVRPCRPPSSLLFPYTTLFRSWLGHPVGPNSLPLELQSPGLFQEAPHRLPQAGLALGDVVQQPAGQLLAFPEEAPSLPEAVVRLVDHRLRELPRPQGEHLHAPEAGQPLLQTPGVPANLLRLKERLLLPPELAFELVKHLHVDQLPFGPRHPEGLPVDLQPLRVE